MALSIRPQTPAAPPAEQAGHVLRQIGIHTDGSPLYAYRDASPVVLPAPVAPAAPARPYGAYIALGIGGAIAISILAMAAAILAVALAIGAVSLTVCLLVLRSMWESWKTDRAAERDR